MTEETFELVDLGQVIKHTATIHITNSISLVQRKAVNILFKNAYKDLKIKDIYEIDLQTLSRGIGWSESKNLDKLKDAIRTLVKTSIEFNVFGKDKKNVWKITTILSEAEIQNGVCKYSYSNMMRKALSNPNIYAKLDLKIQQSIKSKHALAVWEFLTEALCTANLPKVITEFITIDHFKRFLALNDSICYKEFRYLKSQVIVPSIDEINNETDIEVKVNYKKERRKVVALSFSIKRKDNHQCNLITHDSNNSLIDYDLNSELFYILINEFFIQKKNAKNLISKYHSDDIKLALDYVRSQNNKINIDNIPAYTVKAIKEGWNNKKSSNEVNLVNNFKIIEEFEKEVSNSNWKKVRSYLKDSLGETTYISWIMHLNYISIEENTVILSAKTNFIKRYIVEKYTEQIIKAWQNVSPHITYLDVIIKT